MSSALAFLKSLELSDISEKRHFTILGTSHPCPTFHRISSTQNPVVVIPPSQRSRSPKTRSNQPKETLNDQIKMERAKRGGIESRTGWNIRLGWAGGGKGSVGDTATRTPLYTFLRILIPFLVSACLFDLNSTQLNSTLLCSDYLPGGSGRTNSFT